MFDENIKTFSFSISKVSHLKSFWHPAIWPSDHLRAHTLVTQKKLPSTAKYWYTEVDENNQSIFMLIHNLPS